MCSGVGNVGNREALRVVLWGMLLEKIVQRLVLRKEMQLVEYMLGVMGLEGRMVQVAEVMVILIVMAMMVMMVAMMYPHS
jgi:hypothetical protein